MKRDKHDIVFSKLVRERSDYTCQHCLVNFRHNPSQLHCSHFHSRRHVATRWHPQNAFSHCASCHRTLGERPKQFTEWVIDQLGNEICDQIERTAFRPVKWTKPMREEIYQFQKQQYEQMLASRAQGESGMIWFEPHPYMILAMELAA